MERAVGIRVFSDKVVGTLKAIGCLKDPVNVRVFIYALFAMRLQDLAYRLSVRGKPGLKREERSNRVAIRHIRCIQCILRAKQKLFTALNRLFFEAK